MSLTKSSLAIIRKDIEDALSVVAKKHELSFRLNGIRYTENSFKVGLEAVQSSNGESVLSVTFKEKCYKYGLLPEHLGRVFYSGDNSYKITGLKPRNRKYPVIAERTDNGKQFKFSALKVKIALGII